MEKSKLSAFLCLCCVLFAAKGLYAEEQKEPAATVGQESSYSDYEDAFDDDAFDDDYMESEDPEPAPKTIADPLEKINRGIFAFNDKFIRFVLRPVSKVYRKVVHREIRKPVGRAFDNIKYPVRLVGNLMQGKVKGAGRETLRFGMNTVFGIGGMIDVAKYCEIAPSNEDLGQSLGSYGVGPGFYVIVPFLGPSNLRDMVASVPDAYLNPLTYYPEDLSDRYWVNGVDTLNSMGPSIDNYQRMKKAALDPYTLLRDVFHQMREQQVKN